jgi:hypothetical protein
MPKPRVEEIDTIVCADGRVLFRHYRMGGRYERMLSTDTVALIVTLGGCSRAPSSAVAGGNSSSSAVQSEQYRSREPQGRKASRPQRSQYLVSKASNICAVGCWTAALSAGAVFMFLWSLMRAF